MRSYHTSTRRQNSSLFQIQNVCTRHFNLTQWEPFLLHRTEYIMDIHKCFPMSTRPFLHIYSFLDIEQKHFRKTLWKKVKLLKMSSFTFFHNVLYAICILKFFNSYISVEASSSLNLGQSQNSLCGTG